MDLVEQNKFSEELGEFLARKLKDKNYHLIIGIEDNNKGFSFNISTLSKGSTYQILEVVMSGIVEESEAFVEKFKLPSDTKLNKPMEPKW